MILCLGKKVDDLDVIGTFKVSALCKGSSTAKEYTASAISWVSDNWFESDTEPSTKQMPPKSKGASK